MKRFLVTATVLGTVIVSTVLTACLLSIDESRLDLQSQADAGDDSDTFDADNSIDDDVFVPPTPPTPGQKDGSAPIIDSDGGKQCPASSPTLCPDDNCYDLNATTKHCGSCTTPCTTDKICSAGKCVPPNSCKDLLGIAPTTATGLNYLTIGGVARPAYCDMNTAGGGFTLVAKLSSGLVGDPYTIYMGGPQNEDAPAAATPWKGSNHYVSSLLASWNTTSGISVNEVRARLYTGQQAVAELAFNGTGTTRESWFSRGGLHASPWTDLPNPPQYFSIAGHPQIQRRFFVENTYATCDTDSGWLILFGSVSTQTCPYEGPTSNIRIFYAPGPTAQVWTKGAPQADSFAVFVR